MRVLIADDDPALLALTRRILESSGYGVVACTNGSAACEALERGNHRLAILDWDMPGMTGPEVCRRLKLGKSARFIYVIILTVKDAAGHLDIALESGASDFMTKPFCSEDLVARVRAGQRALAVQAQVALAESLRLESIGRLAAGIAHEINTPTQYVGDNTRFLSEAFESLQNVLAAYRGLLEAARRGAVSASDIDRIETSVAAADLNFLVSEIPKAIQQSLEGISRVSDIVRAMKDFSHPDTEEKVSTDLNHAIECTLAVATNEWGHVAELVTDLADDLPHVECLPGAVNQVFLNLLTNATHAIADVVAERGGKGTIAVTTRRDGPWTEIRISDTGPGIPEKFRGIVYDPFFTTKELGRGTGQGLAVARAVVVEKHGGTIDFETEVGKGTTFIVRLPIETVVPSTTAIGAVGAQAAIHETIEGGPA